MRCSACNAETFTGMELLASVPDRTAIRKVSTLLFKFVQGPLAELFGCGTWDGHLVYRRANGKQRRLTVRGFTTPDDAAMALYEQLEQRYPELAG